MAMPKDVKKSSESMLMVTKKGVIKRVDAESFHEVRRNGLIAIKIKTGDELISAQFVDKDDTAILTTSKGQSIRFKAKDIRVMGRVASGVKAMRLRKGDSIIGAGVVKKDARDPSLLVISLNGYGKKTLIKEYKIQKRGGTGIKTAKVTSKTGDLISAKIVTEEDEEIIAISKNSQVIRSPLREIPSLGRQTQGVRIMKLRDKDYIASLVCI